MGYYVPYEGVRLANPISISYLHNCFSVICEDGFHIKWESEYIPFSLSLKTDIERIVSAVNKYVSTYPEAIIFSSTAFADMHILNWYEIVQEHITQWINVHHINPHDILLYLDYTARMCDLDTVNISQNSAQNITFISDYIDNMYRSAYVTGTSSYSTHAQIATIPSPSVEFDIPHNIPITVHGIYTDDDGDHKYSIVVCIKNFDDPIISYMALFSLIRHKYFMKDYLNMSDKDKTYFKVLMETVINSFNQYQLNIASNSAINDISRMHGVDIDELVNDECTHRVSNEYNTDPKVITFIINNAITVWDYISTINGHKILYHYPLSGICNIPAISAYPQTTFQWMLTNQIAKEKFDLLKSFSDQTFIELFVLNERDNTQQLLPYIHASDKALEMYLRYTDSLDENGNYKKTYLSDHSIHSLRRSDSVTFPHGLTEKSLKYVCEQMIQFIRDGIALEQTYPDPIDIDDYGTIKMSPVKGTILKMVRNSIFNHRMETKISLEYKLNALLGDTSEEENRMACTYELTPELELYRIKRKSDLIGLGKLLGHCIGGYINSTDLFFRKDTVCAQVSTKSWIITQCYDAHNKKTDKSAEFNTWLNNAIIMFMAQSIPAAVLCSVLNIPADDQETFDIHAHMDDILINHGHIRSLFIGSEGKYVDNNNRLYVEQLGIR